MREEMRVHTVWLGALLVLAPLVPASGPPPHSSSSTSSKPLSRHKRLLWLTTDGRLALPPGTAMVITTSLSLPFVRYPPDGFLSNISIALPFTINFDKLGLTDNQNPYGVLPPILGRSFGRSAGSLVANYIATMLEHRRKRRSEAPPSPPPEANFHGGERAMLYPALEDLLATFGLDGRACLLRTICEVHSHSLERFGLVGELFKLFLTASQSPFSGMMNEYVEAEQIGMQGECWKFFKGCPKSLFLANEENKYKGGGGSAHQEESHHEVEIEENNMVEVPLPSQME